MRNERERIVTERVYDALNERIYEYDHPSELHIQIIPKRGYRKKFAVLTTDFGSINTEYRIGEKRIQIPDGSAHFLEHKLYEQPEGDVMNQFAALGADCNAATGYSKTYYYFSCTENFEQCLDLLLRHVFHPYFTEQNVEKEKGIIIQEINMYLDDPYYVCEMDLLGLLYQKNPVKKDIAGTETSVRQITPEILYQSHAAFYRPRNMCLTVVGDLDRETVYRAVDRAELPQNASDKIEKLLPDEPEQLVGTRSARRMDTPLPIFNFGFKDRPERYQGKERMRRRLAGSMVKELLFGTSSELYEKLYENGYINYDFYASYEIERDYAMFSISGVSEQIDLVQEYILDYVERLRGNGIGSHAFTVLKNAMNGSLLRGFDSVSFIGRIFGQLYLQGVDAFDYFLSCGTITEEDVNHVIADLLSGDMAVSVIERLD